MRSLAGCGGYTRQPVHQYSRNRQPRDRLPGKVPGFVRRSAMVAPPIRCRLRPRAVPEIPRLSCSASTDSVVITWLVVTMATDWQNGHSVGRGSSIFGGSD